LVSWRGFVVGNYMADAYKADAISILLDKIWLNS